MCSNPVRCKHGTVAAKRAAVAVAFLGMANAGMALAYVGPSFLRIADESGTWHSEPYKNSFKVDGNYWHGRPLSHRRPGASGHVFSGPFSPRQGAGKLVVAIDKDSPALTPLMDKCLKKMPIPELLYAESSDRARPSGELGDRPVGIPEYYEYKLKTVQFSECPVVPSAPQQAIVIAFNDIERLNYHLKENVVDVKFEPKVMAPALPDARTRSFVVTWFAVAHDISDDQCPRMNEKPTEDDYYALVSKEDAEIERAQLASKGGVSYLNGQMGFRGPNRLNVTMLPGIVKDPGNAEPQTKLARGLDLDGNNGSGTPPAGICKHRNFASADGRTGIDNQLYTVQGCTSSFQGHKGFMQQFSNNQRRDGSLSPLVQITDIDNPKNDNSVTVTLFYSLDPMAKNAGGDQALPDYTYRLTDIPSYTHYFTRLRGRIVNGVVTTDRAKELRMNLGPFGGEVQLADAGFRLELAADGTIKGVLGGYKDWREIISIPISSQAEQVHQFHVPGEYNALKRAADGMKNPVTGACDGISVAYDIEGIPAFIAASPFKRN